MKKGQIFKRRVLAWMITLAMVLTMTPINAFAEETGTIVGNGTDGSGNGGNGTTGNGGNGGAGISGGNVTVDEGGKVAGGNGGDGSSGGGAGGVAGATNGIDGTNGSFRRFYFV